MTPEASPQDAWIKFASFLELYRRQLLAAVFGGVVLVGVLYFWRGARERAEAAAGQELLALALQAPGGEVRAEDYLALAGRAGDTRAGKRARLLAAGRLFQEGRYAEAHAQFAEALGLEPDGPLAPQAAFGIAASLDSQDKGAEAEAKYRAVITAFPDDAVARAARLALARLHEDRNEADKALRLYEELEREQPEGGYGYTASERREILLRQHPQLAGTNTVAAVTPPVALTPAPAAP
jgi:tetratricopeptide (TPR) repeat protein